VKIRRLRTKIVLIGIPLLLLGFVSLYATSNVFLLPGFQKIENEEAIKDANRAVDALNSRIIQLDQKTSDWSNWDDTYRFVKDHNKAYIASNLQNESLANLGIDYMLFFNSNNQLVEMKHVQIDSPDLPSLPLDQGMKDLFGPTSPLLQHSTIIDVHNGVVNIPEGIIMIASRPILTSEATGPSTGTLVFAQYIDAHDEQALANLTHLKLTYLPSNNLAVTKSMPVYPSKTSKGTQWVSHLSDTQAQAFASILDIYGKPSLTVQVDLGRSISQQGRNSMQTFLWVSFLVGLLVIIVTSYVLNRLIMNRLLSLSSQLQELKDVQGSTKAVAVSGNDELASLGTAINDLLVQLHNTHDLKRTNSTLEQQVTERTKALNNQLDQMKRTNSLMVDRELKMRTLKEEIAALKAKLLET